MTLSLLLLPFLHCAPAPPEASLLAAVPEDAYVLLHCPDVAALRARAELNDWYRLLGSSEGEPLLFELGHGLRHRNHGDMDELLALAAALEGEVVLFDTGTVAGFVTEPPASRATLSDLMRGWLPRGDDTAERTLELGGATVELVAWPDASGRAGHFAAFVDHPRALALYSGDDSASVMAALHECVNGLGSEHSAHLVSTYLAAGGCRGDGFGFFVDFTPLVEEAEAALARAAEGMLPDPSRLLGLEQGTWLHATAEIHPGTRIDCRARLHLPSDTLASRLADTFKPLPRTLPADLPGGTWGLLALSWDVKRFYRQARAAYEEAGRAEGLEAVDASIEAAHGMSGVDPVTDVLDQLAGDFALYFVDVPRQEDGSGFAELDDMLALGFHAGLIDGGAFQTVIEKLIGAGGMERAFQLRDIAGVNAYVLDEGDGFDGGVAFLPRTLAVAVSRRVLEKSLLALTRAEGASLLPGSRMQATIDENPEACFLACFEMTPLRAYLMPDLEGDLRLPPLEDGQPVRDPFDSQLVGTVRRTPDGFELRLQTR